MANRTIGALTGTAGGTNVPLANMSADAGEPVVVIRAAGLTSPYSTLPVSSLPGAQTEFDFVLTSRADLVAVVAPVGGIFDLPSGSYFIKTSFALNANEGLRIANTNVLIMGGGASKSLTGGSAAIPLVQVTGTGTLQLLTLTLTAAVADVIVLNAGGDLITATQVAFVNAVVSPTNPAVQITGAGRATFDTCRIQSNNRAFRHNGTQRCTISSSRIESVVGTVVEALGAGSWLLITGSIVRTTGVATGQVFFVNNATCNLFVVDCEVASTNNATIMLVSGAGAAAVEVYGGEWQTNSGVGTTGIQLSGPISKGFVCDGTFVQNCATWILHTAGTVGSAQVSKCTGTTNVTTCVNWNVANIPTRGLLEHGNHWNATSANTFTNHQQNDARVMRRSNVSSAGNMSETGIAP